jgi:DNA primase
MFWLRERRQSGKFYYGSSLLIINKYANNYFHGNLTNTEQGRTIGLSYFKERGFREETIKKFELGYSIDTSSAFTDAALANKYKLKYLESTGLTIVNGNNRFDRFRGRVMFPIHSLSGNVIGFGGRMLKINKKSAKYLNSPESEIYHKSQVLYGLFLAKKSITKNDKCYLVEGYTDVLAMHQTGIQNVVASSGTSLTIGQIRLIKRFTPNVTIIYDGDEAGIKASLRGIDLVLEQDLNVKVLLLPEGEDPDSYAKNNSVTEFLKFIEDKEEDFVTFKTKLLSKNSKNDPVKKANLISDIVRSIAIIPDGIKRTIYIKECATILDINEKILYSEINKIRKKNTEKEYYREKRQENSEQKNKLPAVPAFVNEIFSEAQEKELIRLLLHYAEKELYSIKDDKYSEPRIITVGEYIINEILNDELEFKNLIYKQIFEEYLTKINKGEMPEKKQFINHENHEINALAADLLSSSYTLSKIFEKGGAFIETEDMILKKIVPETIIAYKRKILEIAQKELSEKIKKAQTNELSVEEMENLQKEYIIITSAINSLSKERGWVVLK